MVIVVLNTFELSMARDDDVVGVCALGRAGVSNLWARSEKNVHCV